MTNSIHSPLKVFQTHRPKHMAWDNAQSYEVATSPIAVVQRQDDLTTLLCLWPTM